MATSVTAPLAQEIEPFLEQASNFLHNWGFKRIHGKMWALLALTDRPLDAADMIGALSISKALVSISIRELLEVHAVKDVGRSARGTRLYLANLNLQEIAFYLLRTRELPMLHELQSSLEKLRETEAETLKSHELSLEKIASLSAVLQNGSESLQSLLSQIQVPSDSTHSYTHAKPESEPSSDQ